MNNQEQNQTTTLGLALASDQFEAPPIHVPNATGSFKSELTVIRSPELTIKLMWWYADDPRAEPHNHPWKGLNRGLVDSRLAQRVDNRLAQMGAHWDDVSFVSEVIDGGYTEIVHQVVDGKVQRSERSYRAGDINVALHGAYHVVVDVQPKTRTRLTCGASTPGNEWGYLDVNTGEYVSARDPRMADAGFLEKLRAINPHMRLKAPPSPTAG